MSLRNLLLFSTLAFLDGVLWGSGVTEDPIWRCIDRGPYPKALGGRGIGGLYGVYKSWRGSVHGTPSRSLVAGN